jgi:hypothetical protein
MADTSAGRDQAGPSPVERVKAMPIDELQQLLSKGGRRAAVVEAADGATLLRREKKRVKIGGPGARVLTLTQVVVFAAMVPAALTLLFLAWWRPHLGALGGSVVVGMLGGLVFVHLYRKNARRKDQFCQLVRLLGFPGPLGGAAGLGRGARSVG